MSMETRLARLERWNRILLVSLLLVAGGAVAWSPAPQGSRARFPGG